MPSHKSLENTNNDTEANEPDDTIYDRLALNSLRLSDTTDSGKTFSLANRWIDECIEKHPACSHSIDTSWHPTRLLNIRYSVEKQESLVYLVESNTVTPSGPYMTLSHSWGKGHMMTLTKGSYNTLLQGIPISSLPPTFRDACSIAQRLGVQYLWIDALCIFQDKDDLSDWSREASLMYKVYSFSHCNIVAADNGNSSQPIFRKRDPKELNPPTTEALVQTGPLHSSVPTERCIIDYLGYLKPVDDAHINTRGWVMQERFMSPRGLHFGTKQVYWECRQTIASETNPDGLEIYRDGIPFKRLTETSRAISSWPSLVMRYSECALSFPSDKLVAFSAIERLYASSLSDEYVAGMWRGQLRLHLLWKVDSSTMTEHTRYKTYTAPTWSWASIKGRVLMTAYDSDTVEYLYGVDDYKLEYATKDRMGAIRAGWLRLSGHLIKLKLLWKGPGRTNMWSLVINNVEYGPLKHTGERTGGISASLWLDKAPLDPNAETEGGSLYCMLTRHHLFDEVGDRCNMWDFLLFQLVDATRGTFRRIGVARTRTGDVDNPYLAGNLVHRPSEQPSLLPCAAYEDGFHSIYVI